FCHSPRWPPGPVVRNAPPASASWVTPGCAASGEPPRRSAERTLLASPRRPGQDGDRDDDRGDRESEAQDGHIARPFDGLTEERDQEGNDDHLGQVVLEVVERLDLEPP